MKDSYQREITYLRLSVTDRCNLRCRYCMPSCGKKTLPQEEMMGTEEMLRVVVAFAELGGRKVRLTGGEPLLYRDILPLAEGISHTPGIRNLAMTTNGILLKKMSSDLVAAGVSRINVSLDTLNPEKYHRITRSGELKDVLEGIEKALSAGFHQVKINTVLMGGFNEDEIRPLAELTKTYPVDVRFIELMPMVEDEFFSSSSFLSNTKVLEVLPELEKLPQDDSVSSLYTLPGAPGRVGLISPISSCFCPKCNRIRVTSLGKVLPCLHSKAEFSLKGLDKEGMKRVILEAVASKPERHGELSFRSLSEREDQMNEIGG